MKQDPDTSRLGFHYYPDTLHYSHRDLQVWLPILKSLRASWLVLLAPLNRAIPEPFLRGLLEANIQPVLHFLLPLEQPIDLDNLQLLFENYVNWGVRYVILFDRPNVRLAWSTQSWVQSDLAERFLDYFLPPAERAFHAGLTPVLAPLEPGGDYWDTAFLQAALKGIQRRCSSDLLRALTLSAYAWVEDRPLDWGAGGPERWPKSRPYYLPAGHQDQRGFYIFDWYLAVAQAALGDALPILLLGVNSRSQAVSGAGPSPGGGIEHVEKNLELARLVCAPPVEGETADQPYEAVSPRVLACNFWLLTALEDSPHMGHAWFRPDGSSLPVAAAFQEWLSSCPLGLPQLPLSFPEGSTQNPAQESVQSVEHYLLLPLFDWGVSEWYLDAIRPFVIKHRPTIGFSLLEAARARRVTVIGGEQLFAENVLEKLRNAGCRVERISGDGTEIASILATL